jgi:hypothetical protein
MENMFQMVLEAEKKQRGTQGRLKISYFNSLYGL